MLNLVRRSGWLAGALIFFMPVLLTFFLGSQMAYGQVRRSFADYQKIPSVTSLSDLATVAPGEVVILRGRIAEATPLNSDPLAPELVVYQERPDNREVRFGEEFPLVFPTFVLDLPDGSLQIAPSATREHVIQHEPHTVQAGDRVRTGFRSGDVVTVQGQWQAEPAPALVEVTGLTSVERAALIAEWEQAFRQVAWARNGLGLLSLLSIILLVAQFRRSKKASPPTATQESELCPPQSPAIPTT